MSIASDMIEKITKQFKLGPDSMHGISHWMRVERLGLMLAEKTGADRCVVSMFAYLHDSKRENELVDPEHGARAADFVSELHKSGEISISKKPMEQLTHACRYHNDPTAKSADITVMTCWDADRLDLWRVGDTPDPARLNTAAARDPSMIKFASLLLKPQKKDRLVQKQKAKKGREIIFTHRECEELVTSEQMREVEELLADMLFRGWLKEKGFSEEKK